MEDEQWLDSLSEDWIEQPLEESPQPALPSHSSSTSSVSSQARVSSRIPVSKDRRSSQLIAEESRPLGERSPNEGNVPISQRGSRRHLPNEIAQKLRGRGLSRTASASSTGSVQYNTVAHKSSPGKAPYSQETPEWKKRIIQGQVGYGEQVDLLTGGGLEGLFKQPPPAPHSPSKSPSQRFQDSEITMPSSPPPYDSDTRAYAEENMGTKRSNIGNASHRQRNQPKAVSYRMVSNQDRDLSFSEAELSESSVFRPGLSVSQSASQHPTIPEDDESVFDNAAPSEREEQPSRTVSGGSQIRHEGLSPIFISRYNDTNGDIDYAAIVGSTDGTVMSHHGQSIDDMAEELLDSFHIDDDDQSQSLPVNTTSDTHDFALNGRFVNLGRGGREVDESFQRRPLSPSSMPADAESSMCSPKDSAEIRERITRSPNEAEACILNPTVEDADKSEQPLTPNKAPVTSPVRPSTGSPLKLFGTHDTFTANRLLRTLSSIEDNLGRHTSDVSGNSIAEIDGDTTRDISTAYVPASSSGKTSSQHRSSNGDARHEPRRLSKFGEGDLDNFEFSETTSSESAQQPEDTEERSIQSDGSDKENKHQFKFDWQPLSNLEDKTNIHRQTNITSTTTTERIVKTRRADHGDSFSSDDEIQEVIVSKRVENLSTPRKVRDDDTQGKRLLRTPLRDPIPKRRRTLHKGDIAYPTGESTVATVQETSQMMQTILGKKRKDARHGDNQQPAGAEVMASRQVLKPRSASSAARSSKASKNFGNVRIVINPEQTLTAEQQEKIARVQAELDGMANSSSLASSPVQQGQRVGSITTQDFLKDASNVMAALRDKLRGSRLGSVENSDQDKEEEQDSFQESTMEPFSRPPSREGGPLPRLPLQQQDPALLSHLQKYEDTNDMDNLLASSMKSLDIMKNMGKDFDDAARMVNATISRVSSRSFNMEEAFQSDPPNIQITEPLERKRKHSTSSMGQSQSEVQFESQGSNSSGPSTGRTAASGMSKSSENVKVIAPGSVSHLIPEELAGMVYDRERGAWVKRKLVMSSNFLPSDDTDDDPFGDIPDLTVDETREMERVEEVEARKKQEERYSGIQQYGKVSPPSQNSTPSPDLLHMTAEDPTPAPRNGVHKTERPKSANFIANDASHSDAKSSRDPTTMGVLKTKSIETETVTRETRNEKSVYSSPEKGQRVVEEFDEEISIYESRRSPSKKAPRKVTISFSSPIASIIQPSDFSQLINNEFDEESEKQGTSKAQWSGQKPLHSTKARSSSRSVSNAPRKNGPSAQNFVGRPVSRIDERDEESVLSRFENGNLEGRSVSIIVTPRPSRSSSREFSMIRTPSLNLQPDALLELSPLSAFTTHQRDESFAFEVSMLHQTEQRPHQVRASDGNRALSLSVKNLVESITDVEAYEPYWEHMKQLKLKNRRLQSLHMLSEFCGRLEVLDISQNEIEQLDGAPVTLRHLSINHNIVSDLTSWSMLRNLQYLDVSDNELTSLDGFKELVHLRSLRADNNRITSMHGVMHLDGLITLRLRGNAIESLDFSASDLPRLTDLDLKGNAVSSIKDLCNLTGLANLNLEDNKLPSFPVAEVDCSQGLKYLKLSGNCIEYLDVSGYTNLRVLYLDRNRISNIAGLHRTKHLDSLSLREQSPDTKLSPSIFHEAFEIRKLFLSGNLLGQFDPPVPYLNLQYLEMSSCGLNSLPDLLGLKLPNLRILNVNFNALTDLEPLTMISRLKVLHVAGNRLGALDLIAMQLSNFKALTRLDMRSNPSTLGFYPPACEKRTVGVDIGNTTLQEDQRKSDPFIMEDGDKNKDKAFEGRLDIDTAVKRRIYELMLINECGSLRYLDGLPLARGRVARRDRIFSEMMRLGLIETCDGQEQRKEGDGMERFPNYDEYRSPDQSLNSLRQASELLKKAVEKVNNDQSMMSEIWGAEDSFA